MFYGSNEDRKKAIETRIKAYREAAALFPTVKNIILKYDNKVFNCRFENALKEAVPGFSIWAKKEYKNLVIYYYPKCDNRYLTLAYVPLDKLPDGKRIPGDLLIESLQEKRIELLKCAADMERQLTEIDFITAQIEDYKNKINKLVNMVSYDFRDVFGLKTIY